MVDAANLLLGTAAGPEQTQCSAGCQAATDQDPLSSPFLAIVHDLMGPEEQASGDQVRAGQQAVPDEQPEETPDAVEISCLLGSMQPACVDVQALPVDAVVQASTSVDVPAPAVPGNNFQVAPSPAQPIVPEQSTEPVVIGSSVAPQSAEPLRNLPAGTATAVIDTATPVNDDQPVRVGIDRSVQPGPRSQGTTDGQQPVPDDKQVSDAQAGQSAPDARAAAETSPRRHGERADLPEYLRNIVPQEDSRPAGRTVSESVPQITRPVAEADPELVTKPVDLPGKAQPAADAAGADPGIRWTPIEPRPTVEQPSVVAQSRPVEQVERATVIHQIVRSAKAHVFDGGGEMVMRLEPAHLGSIRMSVTADHGIVTAHLKAGTESVRQVLEAEIVTLRQSLAESGIHVDTISVSVGDNLGEGWNWHASQHNGSQHAGRQQNGYTTARLYRDDTGAISADQPTAM